MSLSLLYLFLYLSTYLSASLFSLSLPSSLYLYLFLYPSERKELCEVVQDALTDSVGMAKNEAIL